MAEVLANQVETKISMVAGLDSDATTLTVVDGSGLPATGDFRLAIGTELLKATARTGEDITVVRGQEGTTAQAHADGTTVALVLTAAALETYVSENGGAGSGFANPMTDPGDLIVGGTAGAAGRLAKGTDDEVLTMVAGQVEWAVAAGGGMSNPMDAAGDIIIGGTGGAPTKLAKGTDGQVLKLASGAPAWGTDETGGASAMVGALALIDGDQGLADSVFTQMSATQEKWDTDGFHENVTNKGRMTIPSGKDGTYLLAMWGQWPSMASGGPSIRIYKNGTTKLCGSDASGAVLGRGFLLMTVAALVATDYIDFQLFANAPGVSFPGYDNKAGIVCLKVG